VKGEKMPEKNEKQRKVGMEPATQKLCQAC
jgi:hypothetical protein